MHHPHLSSFSFATLSSVAVAAIVSNAHAAEPIAAMSSDDATVLTGGIGGLEREHLLDVAPRYELVASFARHGDGAMLSNVDVTVKSEALKEPIEITTDGPLFLASLPNGHYTVTARLPGWKTRVREIDVQRWHNQRLYITFVPDSE
jgi:hypothetical protein